MAQVAVLDDNLQKYHAAGRAWELCGEDTVSDNDTSGEAALV